MMSASLLAAVLLAQASAADAATPAATLSLGTGMRYGMFGVRGALPLHESWWVSVAIGVPPQVYIGAIDGLGSFRDVVPPLEDAEEGWPAFAASLAYHLPIGEGSALQAAFTSMFLRGDRVVSYEFHGVTQTSAAFSLVFGVQQRLFGSIYADLGIGPSLTYSDFTWVEEGFDRTELSFGLDWVLGFGYMFL